MAENTANTAITITRNTAISVSLALSIAVVFATNEVRYANTQNDLNNAKLEIVTLKAELKEVQIGYVTKQELNHTMQLIQKDLKTLADNQKK